jgi:predicted  nucleic acid-binding Zn-ribbon protein
MAANIEQLKSQLENAAVCESALREELANLQQDREKLQVDAELLRAQLVDTESRLQQAVVVLQVNFQHSSNILKKRFKSLLDGEVDKVS